jgi:hypothetical protein
MDAVPAGGRGKRAAIHRPCQSPGDSPVFESLEPSTVVGHCCPRHAIRLTNEAHGVQTVRWFPSEANG